METIRLTDITEQNWETVCNLDPGEQGRGFVADNTYSIAQFYFEKTWTIKAIEHSGEIVGFTMYGFSRELDGFELCRFMIDKRFQNKGYGRAALSLIIGEMFRCFPCRHIYLTASPYNARALHLYQEAGFTDTGKPCGTPNRPENIFILTK